MSRRWRDGLARAGAAVVLVAMASCSVLPPRQVDPRPLPPRAATERITLQDHRGAVPAAVKTGDLARLRAEGQGALVQHHLGVLAAAGEVDLYRGNSARLLVDGPQAFAAMKAAVAAAQHSVLLESYIVEDGGVAAEFAELLLRKAAQGVRVALLYDSVGSIGSDAAFFERLRAGGVAVCAYNPVNPLERPGHWGLLQRNHRKMLAVDSDVGFTGGINLSNVYAEGSSGGSRLGGSGGGKVMADDEGWRDTQVELRGPVAPAMAALFRHSWASQGCPGALPPAPAPRQPAPGRRVVKVVAGDPNVGVNPTYQALLAAVDASVVSVHLTMAYFAPGPDMVQALSDAAARGVDVQLVLPGRSDVKLVLAAARSYYTQLLQAGVQIHEMQRTVMHAKTAVIDGVFSSVGSSNLDWRSILVNAEIDVIVLGDDFGQELEALFQRDVRTSTRIDPQAWQQRGLGQRMLEGLGRLFEPLL
jgi:cardiolipin synthase